MEPLRMNTLYYGDNLDIMRQYIANESVDLVQILLMIKFKIANSNNYEI
jgi:hypothetical protein